VTRAADFMEALGFDPVFAAAYQLAINNVGLQTTFRVRSLGLDWDGLNEGVTLDFECVNYIEVRADKDLEESEQLVPDDPATPDPTPVVVEDQVQ